MTYRGRALIDITGKRFGRYVVLHRVETDSKLSRWLCRCDCGRQKEVFAVHLRSGKIVSCGCWAADKARERATHGQSNSRAYFAWRSMLNRCLRPKDKSYKDYGGRGIVICDEWLKSFEHFYADMGDCPSEMQLDRKDNDGPYCKDNCRWATRLEQSNNKRSNVFVEYGGERLTLKQLSIVCGVKYKALFWRIRVAKWPIEKAAMP